MDYISLLNIQKCHYSFIKTKQNNSTCLIGSKQTYSLSINNRKKNSTITKLKNLQNNNKKFDYIPFIIHFKKKKTKKIKIPFFTLTNKQNSLTIHFTIK